MPAVGALNDVEAAKLAVTVERIGQAFYAEAARFSESRQATHTFQTLARQEEAHRSRFEALMASLAAKRAESWNNPVTEGYIRALVQTSIFPDVATAQALGRALETEEDALRLALKLEKDSVLFYTTAAQAARSPASAAAFNEIAEEERRHVVTVHSHLNRVRKNAGRDR